MPKELLVASPDQSFGEWLCDSLASHGDYAAHRVQSGGDVLVKAASIHFDLAILDADLPGEPFVPLVRGLQAILPEVKLLVIPPENVPRHPVLTGLKPDGYLRRPFYFPDFLELLGTLLAARGPRPGEVSLTPLVVARADERSAFSWLEDQSQAEAQLARLLLETSAQAALITVEGKIWASACALGQAVARDLAAHLSGCFNNSERFDVARYTRIESIGGEHLLYATAVLDELALGLLYPASTPLSQARAQAGGLARALVQQVYRQELPENVTEDPPVAIPAAAEALSFGVESDPDELILEEEPQIDLAALLAGMPSPDPGGKPLFPPVDEAPAEAATPVVEEEIVFPWEQPQEPAEIYAPAQDWEARISAWTNAIEPAEATLVLERQQTDDDTRVVIPRLPGETQPLLPGNGHPGGGGQPDTVALLAEIKPEMVNSNRLSRPPDTSRPADPSRLINEQTYTCLLLPACPEHLLTSDMIEQLSRWLPNLCQAFGWRLQSVLLRPGYLQMTVRLDPVVSPGMVVRILRQRTSERIFNRYPEYQTAAAETDFWAAEHLVVSGPQPPSAQVVREFIQRTRRRQGFTGLIT